jgi:hypothetical protein
VPDKFEHTAANLGLAHVAGPARISRQSRRSCQHMKDDEDRYGAHTPMSWDNRDTAMAVGRDNL